MLEVPLKPTFFPPVDLTAAEVASYRQAARRSLDQLQYCVANYAWKRVESREGLLVGKVHCIEQDELDAHRKEKSAACLVMRGATTVRGTVREVLEIVAASGTDNYRKTMHRLYPKKFLDGLSLAVVPSDTPHDRLAVKWCAFKDDYGGRDYCFLEYTGLQVRSGEPPSGFCVFHSIERDGEIPSLGAFGLRRDTYRRTGYLVVPSATPDMVHVTLLQQSSAPLDLTMDKWEQALYQRLMSLTQLGPLIAQRRLSALPIIDRSLWVPDAQRKFCAVCLSSFHFRRKHHCRVCGEVVCAACAEHQPMDVPVLGIHNVRVCTYCISKANAAAKSSPPAALQTARRQSVVLLEDMQLQLPPKKASLGLPMRAKLEDIYPSQAPRSRRALTELPPPVQLLPAMTDELFLSQRSMRPEAPHGEAALPPAPVALQQLVSRISSIKQAIAEITSAPLEVLEPESVQEKAPLSEDSDDAPLTLEQQWHSNNDYEESPPKAILYGRADRFTSSSSSYDNSEDDACYRPSLLSERTSLMSHFSSSLSSSLSSASTSEEVDYLKQQVDELHRMLDAAHTRLGDFEAAQTQRQIKYCESQSGNAPNDPVLTRRRETYKAMLAELHDIMGIPSASQPDTTASKGAPNH
ncbi:hypothetical protein ACHHYP_03939 [Achlya hypogyna]|uniref:FYVE-type domain-containing protein n=1 Tax=Achlya hypogyna TaxID=1202772 RepID=A0A1V9ZPL0_ACHHY|nr:hypothetical protein ACHHYP_03939 [Achlya hypogyna]